MKNILAIILCVLSISAYSQDVNDVNYLVSHSSEIPNDSLKTKLPVFYQTLLTENNKDTLIKKVYFMSGVDTKGTLLVKNNNQIFINQSLLLSNNSSLLENKAISDLYGAIGYIHSEYEWSSNIGIELRTQREIYISEFKINKILALDKRCDFIKYIVEDYENKSLSTVKIIAKALDTVINTPLYKQFYKYSTTCAISDKPSGIYDLHSIAMNAINIYNKQQIEGQQRAIEKQKEEQEAIQNNQASQQQPQPPARVIDQHKIDITYAELRKQQDNFDGHIFFYDKRVDINQLRGDGLFVDIKYADDVYNLQFGIYHKVGPYTTPSEITDIEIKSGNNVNNVHDVDQALMGNGTQNAYAIINEMGANQYNYYYKIYKEIVTSNSGSIRFHTTTGIIDYTLSNREIKELKTVLDAWDASNGFN